LEPDRDTLLDLVHDLQHDLGRYLLLPLQLLPTDAPTGAVRAAVQAALLRTRQGPTGVTSAASLWHTFCQEAGPTWRHLPAGERLQDAVVRALAWSTVAVPVRAEVVRDFTAVADAIRALRQALETGAP